jgi:SAM-dependent methyltransferase
MATVDEVREQVRFRYAAAAVAVSHSQGCGCGDNGCGSAGSCCSAEALDQDDAFGSRLYVDTDGEMLPKEAVLASLGCGNPVAVADLHPGDRVLDLGSGGGIDVLLSAARVGPAGFAYGVDMTEEMLQLARANAAKAGATNVEFLAGTIEDLPLSDASVDVIISNCVINLSGDKPAVIAEMFRVLVPGGRIGISDVVAEDHLTEAARAARGSFSGCIAGALSKQEYLDGLAAAGFVDADLRFTHEVEPQMHAAIIKATKPASQPGTESAGAASVCCSTDTAGSCCEPTAKSACCGGTTGGLPDTCGCR